MNEALIQINDEYENKCRLPTTGIPLFFGFFGTAIAELMIRGKLGVQKPKKSSFNGKFDVDLVVLDPQPIQDDCFLAYVFEKIEKRPNRSIGVTINDLSRGFLFSSEKKVFKMVSNGLVSKGVVTRVRERGNFFGTRGYRWADNTHKINLESNCKTLAHTDIKIHENFLVSDYVREIILMLTLKRYIPVIVCN
ncbi:Golgi phosphoprotein 3 family protein [Heterostelium album PN500]|uniref:Golgi phosphoprotein 3 family protein n=1 Tax=Heterostelium pallidum (strain ATCC 26659 / Pp 5 / PN500) TaxID=670386 RepID=D3BAU9_HETP5|nr:Golgi phosphoprotein 3 family protein [Heterostelium album PN500]EFA81686.1 Golgi phosphoprotein 3 family protein [Heterostelium album PN500]|eukprot:XP_020433803.1 Golgi phosphoprotein 3 family protein [Heterostelium album PN500]